MTEALLMGLRTREGVDLDRIAGIGNHRVQSPVNHRAVRTLAAEGLVTLTGSRLAATEPGMPALNAILAALAAD